MGNGIVLCFVTVFGFGSWPLIARASGANAAWATTVIMTVTVLVATALQARMFPALPSVGVFLALVLAGIVNGIGIVAYGRIVTGSQFEVSRLVSAVSTLMIAYIAIGGIIAFGEPLTRQKALGIALAIAAAWLLTKK